MGTRSNRLGEAVLTSTHNLCFVQKYEKYLSFLSEKFQFLEIKFSIYLNDIIRKTSEKSLVRRDGCASLSCASGAYISTVYNIYSGTHRIANYIVSTIGLYRLIK